MPSVEEFWDVAAQVASERGGLVVGFVEDATQPEVGSTLDNVLGFTPRRPLTIIGFSDWNDWQKQVDAFYRLRPHWGRGKPGDPNAKYYRVKFPDGYATSRSHEAAIQDLPFSSVISLPSFSGYTTSAGKLRGATFLPRAGARAIDFTFHYFVGRFSGFLFGLMLVIAAGGRPPAWVLARISHVHLPAMIAGLLGSVCYFVICESIHGSTLGKLVLSLQVLQEDGTPCRVKSAIIRELGYFVDAMFFGLIGYWRMRDTVEQQRLGDEWAHTIVFNRSDVPAESKQSTMRFVLGLVLGIFADAAVLMMGLLVQMNS